MQSPLSKIAGWAFLDVSLLCRKDNKCRVSWYPLIGLFETALLGFLWGFDLFSLLLFHMYFPHLFLCRCVWAEELFRLVPTYLWKRVLSIPLWPTKWRMHWHRSYVSSSLWSQAIDKKRLVTSDGLRWNLEGANDEKLHFKYQCMRYMKRSYSNKLEPKHKAGSLFLPIDLDFKIWHKVTYQASNIRFVARPTDEPITFRKYHNFLSNITVIPRLQSCCVVASGSLDLTW